MNDKSNKRQKSNTLRKYFDDIYYRLKIKMKSLLILLSVSLAQNDDQPEKWPVIGTLSYQYSETKSHFTDDQGITLN